MRGRTRHIILIMLLLVSGLVTRAQNRNNLITTGKNLILLIDLNSPSKDIDTILKHAAITGVKAQTIVNGDYSAIVNDGWSLTVKENNILQFTRPLRDLKKNAPENPFVVTADLIKDEHRSGYLDNAVYGVNDFSNVSVYELPNGFTRFVLRGFADAKRVILAGGFNEWSTLRDKMTKTATGWQFDIKLEAKAWMYKFIVDGHWMSDPDNRLQSDDNDNSVYYKYNHVFKLKGYTSAQKVSLAGSFNDWDENELHMEKTADGWELPIFIHEGTHLYGFYVDGKWMPDPANKDQYKDEHGKLNSVLDIGETVYFKLKGHLDANDVYIAGNFNKWQEGRIAMHKTDDGWSLPLILATGNYDYRFIVDGNWMPDPDNQNKVREGGEMNSFIAVKPNYTFKLKGHGNAKKVILSGTFNDWDKQGYTMAHLGDEWVISMRLKPGKQLYKFIVDGEWMIDPDNKLYEDNQYHTGNSVLWIAP
jgi:hypothetical protein